jgi:hypothetical protein
MGYRSEVAYAVKLDKYHENDKELMAQLKANDLNLDDIWQMYITEIKIKCPIAISNSNDYGETLMANHKERWLRFHDHDLKWYENYEGVQQHHMILDIAKEYNKRYSDDYNLPDLFDTAFARIGEEDGDIDAWFDNEGMDMFYPVTLIEGDFMAKEKFKGEKL